MDFFEEEPITKSASTIQRQPGGIDPRTRRWIPIVIGVVVIILIVLGVKGCVSNRQDRAYKDYSSNAAELIKESNTTGQDFFGVLSNASSSTPLEIEKQVNSFRADAESQLARAKKLNAPGGLSDARKWLEETLLFRYQALDQVSKLLPAVISNRKNTQDVNLIAGQMQQLLASDVVYLERFVPDVREQLASRGLEGDVQLPTTRFLNNTDWLTAATVQDALGIVGGKAATPGVHGVSLDGVTVMPTGDSLSQDGATTITLSPKLAFQAQVSNQGDSEETDVTVTLTIKGRGGVNLEQTISKIGPGETKSAVIPFSASLPTGATTIDFEAQPVAGEQLKDNNKASYPVVFTR